MVSRTSAFTPVASDDLVHAIDQQQYTIGQGPCLTATTAREPVVRVDDLVSDTRWPEFAEATVGLVVRSMLSFQLYTDTRIDNSARARSETTTLGALNVYAAQAHAFTDDSVHMGALIATHAAVAANAVTTIAHLRSALASRDVIGQAKGILMERHKIAPQEAFHQLITASQHHHRKLRDVAADLADSGRLALE